MIKGLTGVIVILIFSAVVLIAGCAKTVTERVPFGSTMTVSVNFAGNIDFVNSKYYMVIASRSDYQLPLPSPMYEFIEPGIPPADPQVDYYQYYSTWSGYVVVDAGMIYLVPGPFTSSGESYQRIQVGGPVPVGRNQDFHFRLDQLFGDDPPDTIYFDFVSVPATHYIADHLERSGVILQYQGMIASGSGEGGPSGDPSLDILDWTVTIQ